MARWAPAGYAGGIDAPTPTPPAPSASESRGGVALVHDYLLVWRGAERTFGAMAACWPGAPVYTLLHDPEGVGHRFADRRVTTSFLQRSGVRQGGFQRLLPLFPLATARLPLQGHGLVVSSSSAFAHGVHVDPDATHVCYCHSPFRYAWHERERGLAELPRAARPAVSLTLDAIRRWDAARAREVTHFVANSRITQERIGRFWGRDSTLVHPPVAIDRFAPEEPEDYLLVVTEIVGHKRVEVALEAARRAGRRLKVVGTGRDLERLKAAYASSADFLGRVGDADLASLYARAAAYVLPNVEEFGIAAVEAQAAGRPVIAADAGGAQETVVDGETGVLVPPGDVDALAEALRHTDYARFDSERIVENARRFSTESFQRRFTEEVRRAAGQPVAGAAPR